MLFSLTYLSLTIVACVLYYAYFKKYASFFFPTISILILSYWDINSTILALILTGITYIFKIYYPKKTWIAIAIHLLVLVLFKTELTWLQTNPKSEELQLFIFLGLSYYSLQNIAILLDKNKTSLNNLMTANLFFPKFIAGPFLLPKEITSLKWDTSFQIENIAAGTQRIIYGLAKKLILADRLSVISNNIFNASSTHQNLFSISFSAIIFTIQMYIDFSAYSDIAIGSAKLFGIDLKENFKLPLHSKNITEYWRRTHSSLIEWLTNYIYYPLVYTFRKHTFFSITIATLTTFTLSGYWHGGSVGYLIWGILNGIYLLFEYTWRKLKLPKLNYTLSLVLSLLFISFSNLFFRLKTWENIKEVVSNIVSNNYLPNNWMIDFIAIIGNGGHLIQQYNLIETSVILFLFLFFENNLEQKANNNKFSYTYIFATILSILFFGNFNAGDEFIYVQF